MHSTNSSPNSNPSITHQHMAVCGSTNSELLYSLAEAKIDKDQPYLLTASSQTSGRGQRTRTWQSPVGNIYLSLYHPLPVSISGLLSLVVGYHLTRLPIIQQINRQRRAINLPLIGVKWANDLGYYDARNRFNKLAGILIEPVLTANTTTGVIVGVGLNIEAAPKLSELSEDEMGYQAVSLTQIMQQTQQALEPENSSSLNNPANLPKLSLNNSAPCVPKAEDLYHPLSVNILRAINQFIDFSHTAYSLPRFIEDYSAVSVLTGRQVQISQKRFKDSTESAMTTTEALMLEGEVVGLNQDGSLQLKLKDEGKIISVYTGTIRLI